MAAKNNTETKIMFSFRIFKLFTRLNKSLFIRHVSVLASGAFLSQVITFSASPLLTRLYAPSEFAVLALFTAIVSSFSAAAGGRYDIAVVVAKEEKEAHELVYLSFWVALSTSILLFSVFHFRPFLLWKIFEAKSLGSWLYVAPLMVFLSAVGMALRCYANRIKDYAIISSSSVISALSAAGLSIILGKFRFTADGLLISTLLAACIFPALIYCKYKKVFSIKKIFFRHKLVNLAVKYKQFPIYNASTTFLDSLTLALPIFFLNRYFSENIVGYYALLTRVATAPIGFISQAVSEIHIKKVAELIHLKKNPVIYLKKISLFLVAIVLPPTFFLMLTGPELFAFFFGEPWRAAGSLLVILMPALAVRFIVSTVSGVFAGTGNNHIGGIWKVSAFIITLGMFGLLSGKTSVRGIFFAMLMTDLFLYCLYYFLIWKAIKNPQQIS